jgi:hypothetical protein
MRFLGKSILVGALAAAPVLVGCSKKEPEAPPQVVEQPAAPVAAPAAQSTPSVQNVQQVKASWDAVSQTIAKQDYDNAIRMWAALDKAQRQAQMNEAVRQEYERRFYEAREALRQKAETDARAREAYQALGRAITGR